MICITDWGFTNCDASRDVEGDRREGIPTFPVTYGIPRTAKLVAAAWVVGVILSIALGAATGLGPIYFAAALVAGGGWSDRPSTSSETRRLRGGEDLLPGGELPGGIIRRPDRGHPPPGDDGGVSWDL